MAKYDALRDLLRSKRADLVTLSLEQVEAVVDGGLPASAHRHRAWWGNDASGRHVQATAWLSAGRRVEDLSLGGPPANRWVAFARVEAVSPTWDEVFRPAPEQWGLRGDPYVWDEMARHLGRAPVPPSREEALAALHAAFVHVVRADARQAGSHDFVIREEFAHGGMSSGGVALGLWQEHLLPMLADRAVDCARRARPCDAPPPRR